MLSCFFVVISINMMLEVINSAKLMSLSFNRGMLQNKRMGGGVILPFTQQQNTVGGIGVLSTVFTPTSVIYVSLNSIL